MNLYIFGFVASSGVLLFGVAFYIAMAELWSCCEELILIKNRIKELEEEYGI